MRLAWVSVMVALVGFTAVWPQMHAEGSVQNPCDPATTNLLGNVLMGTGSLARPEPLSGLEGATVRVVELGIQTLSDAEGGYALCDIPLTELRPVTIVGDKAGVATHTVKNVPLIPGRTQRQGLILYADGLSMTDDFCAFDDGGSLSAGVAEMRDVPCQELGLGPEWKLRRCLGHALRQMIGPGGGPLVGVTGILLDPSSDQGVAGAALSLPDFGLTAQSDTSGCFGMSPLELPSGPSSARLINLEVRAEGFRPLTLRNVLILFNLGIDVQLQPGSTPMTVDRCIFESPPQSQRERALADLCVEAGYPAAVPAGGGAPDDARTIDSWILLIGAFVLAGGLAVCLRALHLRC